MSLLVAGVVILGGLYLLGMLGRSASGAGLAGLLPSGLTGLVPGAVSGPTTPASAPSLFVSTSGGPVFTGQAGAGILDPSHRYEIYDPTVAPPVYRQVPVSTIADLIRRKQPVYDRTAKFWVYHPKYSRTSAS